MMSAIPAIRERCESSDLSKVFREPDILRVEKDISDISQVLGVADILWVRVVPRTAEGFSEPAMSDKQSAIYCQ
jgi:hypothetical protein